MDPLVALTFAASHTSRVQLGTSTLNGLWQLPIMLARSLPTLDLLSQGRLTVGLGLGWMPDEYTAVSVPSRLRRVRVLGTVPIPPAISRRPREEEGQEASGGGEGPEAAE
ncbi:LLM class flavin-dependent oxidoreductase [Streptomyces sp. NPDC002346]